MPELADRASTRVSEIGDAAGVLSGSLYHHFDSKEAIVDEILSSHLDTLLARYRESVDRGDDPVSTLRALVVAAFSSLHPHRAAITVPQNERNHLAALPGSPTSPPARRTCARCG